VAHDEWFLFDFVIIRNGCVGARIALPTMMVLISTLYRRSRIARQRIKAEHGLRREDSNLF